MYVERIPLEDLPKGARILTPAEVLDYYNSHIFGTSRVKEVWFLKHGFIVSGCTALLTNLAITSYYRKRVKIFGFLPTVSLNMILVALPSAFAAMYHYTECRQRILLSDLCTPCLYGRAAVYQNLFAVLYGIGPSALGCFMYAGIRDSYPVPGFNSLKDAKASWELWKKFSSRKILLFCFLFVANTALITFLTHRELEEKDGLDKFLQEQRKKLKSVAKHYEEEK